MLKPSRVAVTLAAMVAGVGMGAGAAAQDSRQDAVDVAALQAQFEQSRRLGEAAADPEAFAARVVAGLKDVPADRGKELVSMLATLSPDKLLKASGATSRNEALDAAGFRPPSFGQTTSELVFYPLTPCRLFDTRLAVGALAPGVVRTLGVNGTPGNPGDLSGQGGAASDCGVPVDPAAVVVTLAAVTPTGAGNIRAWDFGGPVPLASAINYGPALPALANTTVIPVCMGCGTGLDIDVRSDASTVHIVGDVVGYFWAPVRSALSCSTVSTTGATLPANGIATISSPGCPAGTTLTGGGIDTNFSTAEIWIYASQPNAAGTAWTCTARSQYGFDWPFFDCHARCCSTPGL